MSPHVRRLIAELDERLRADGYAQQPAVRLPFNGTLSADEQRMLEQSTFEEIAA
jgi:hypothetical protein